MLAAPVKARRRWILLAIFFAVAIAGAAAQGMYRADDPAVVELRRLYAGASLSFPVSSFPVGRGELAAAARRLEELRPALAESLGRYGAEFLGPDPKGLASRLVLGAAPRLNLESPGFSLDAPDVPDYRSLDFAQLFSERASYGGLSLGIYYDARLSLELGASLFRNYFGESQRVLNFLGSGDDDYGFDTMHNVVTRGMLSYDLSPMVIEFGRGQLDLGSVKGSLLVSDRLPFLDQFRLRLPLAPFSLDWVVASLENRLSTRYEGQEDLPFSVDADDIDDLNPNLLTNDLETMAFLCLHRYEWVLPRLRLALTGQCILARVNNSFALGDFFPFFSWHQSDFALNNLCVFLEADIALARDLNLYLQGGLDEVNANDFGVLDALIPTIPAVVAALDYTPRIGPILADFYLEAGYTHYLWGNFDATSYPNLRHTSLAYLCRGIYRWRLSDNGRTLLLPLNSPYGPGAIWVDFTASLPRPLLSVLYLDFGVRWLSLNSEANLIDTEYVASQAIADAARTSTLSIMLGVEARFLPECSVYARPSLHVQDGAAYGALEFGLTLKLDVDKVSDALRRKPAAICH